MKFHLIPHHRASSFHLEDLCTTDLIWHNALFAALSTMSNCPPPRWCKQGTAAIQGTRVYQTSSTPQRATPRLAQVTILPGYQSPHLTLVPTFLPHHSPHLFSNTIHSLTTTCFVHAILFVWNAISTSPLTQIGPTPTFPSRQLQDNHICEVSLNLVLFVGIFWSLNELMLKRHKVIKTSMFHQF